MKRILLIATGGTIASTEDGNGLSPALTGEELAQSVPEISGLCELDVVQPMNIDSTNMRPSDWMRIRDVIVEGYADHDGFVIMHGTDTMSYTAAALSYLIQDSPKPIVLTGSQKPMGNPFTDAKLNLYQSLLYALDEHSHDVSIVFGGVAIAGTRARKQRTMSFNAFISVNYPPIAYIRNDRIVRNGLHGTRQGENPVRFYDSIDPRVFVLKLTPGVNPGILDALADSYDAVILETFGIGGIPEFGESGESFQEAIFRWVDSGRTVVMTTQVPEEGLDLGVYEVGRAYADHPGILRGDDMTTETLVAKTMWALGQSRDATEIQRLFYSQVNHDRIPMACTSTSSSRSITSLRTRSAHLVWRWACRVISCSASLSRARVWPSASSARSTRRSSRSSRTPTPSCARSSMLTTSVCLSRPVSATPSTAAGSTLRSCPTLSLWALWATSAPISARSSCAPSSPAMP